MSNEDAKDEAAKAKARANYPSEQGKPTPTYDRILRTTGLITGGWGKASVTGSELLPESGPVLLIGNHDSYWDPVTVGTALLPRRKVQALAKSTLWKTKPLAAIMNGMGQIPIERGGGDSNALDEAIKALRAGACVGIFPEGTISRGQFLRPRSGAGRLAVAVPEARILGVATRGTVDIVRFPTRPNIEIEVFEPTSGQLQPGETAAEVTERVMKEVRERAPITIPGRKKTYTKYERLQQEAATQES